MIDAKTKKILHEEIVTKQAWRKLRGVLRLIRAGNYIGTSKGMEGEAFRRVVKCLEVSGLLAHWKVIVCDQDSSVLSQLRNDPRLKGVLKAGGGTVLLTLLGCARQDRPPSTP